MNIDVIIGWIAPNGYKGYSRGTFISYKHALKLIASWNRSGWIYYPHIVLNTKEEIMGDLGKLSAINHTTTSVHLA